MKVSELIDGNVSLGKTLTESTATVAADKDKLTADQAKASADALDKANSDATVLDVLKRTGPVLVGGTTLYENEGGLLRKVEVPDAAAVDVPDEAPPAPAPAPAPDPVPPATP